MRSRHWLAVLRVLGVFWGEVSLGAAARAETIERVLAVVDGRPVFLSEVNLVQKLQGLDLRAAVEAAIDERLMEREAGRLLQASTSSEEEESAYRSLLERHDLSTLGGDKAGARRLARRQLSILKYLEFRFRPQVRIEDEALRSAYELQYGGDPNAPTFDTVAPALREKLEAERLDSLVGEWVKELRGAADTRVNPLGVVPASPAPQP